MKKLIPLSLIVLFAAYKTYDLSSVAQPLKAPTQNSVSLMTYNVENLFDTLDDPKKNDETFLPLFKKTNAIQEKCKKAKKYHWQKECLQTNWTDLKLKSKMSRLAQVIKVKNPDILFLQEVENIDVLNKFNTKYLGYPYVFLIEGPDERGIDTALLSKFKNTSDPKLHLQDYNSKNPTRGILEVELLFPNKEKVKLYSVHFPSQGSKTRYRKKASEKLNSLITKNQLHIAGGDFNIIKKEHTLYQKVLAEKWFVSQLEGCSKCKGSSYYNPTKTWSFLDALLVSKNYHGPWKLKKESIEIVDSLNIQKNKYGSPKKFYGGEQPTGVSDHFPVYLELTLGK